MCCDNHGALLVACVMLGIGLVFVFFRCETLYRDLEALKERFKYISESGETNEENDNESEGI